VFKQGAGPRVQVSKSSPTRPLTEGLDGKLSQKLDDRDNTSKASTANNRDRRQVLQSCKHGRPQEDFERQKFFWGHSFKLLARGLTRVSKTKSKLLKFSMVS